MAYLLHLQREKPCISGLNMYVCTLKSGMHIVSQSAIWFWYISIKRQNKDLKLVHVALYIILGHYLGWYHEI